MNLAFVKTPKFVKWFFHKRIWAFSRSENSVFLTFDDGPIPGVTPWVLAQLKKHNAKATFFCIGDNIEKHTSIFNDILAEGHSIGNHTQHHINGWKTSTKEYLWETKKCEDTQYSKIENQTIKIDKLFRPPYGKMTSEQANKLLKLKYNIVMWDVLSKDYDSALSPEKCLNNVLRNIKPGSIIVFHDSLKAEKNLRYVLPKVLKHIDKNGWKCKKIARSTS